MLCYQPQVIVLEKVWHEISSSSSRAVLKRLLIRVSDMVELVVKDVQDECFSTVEASTYVTYCPHHDTNIKLKSAQWSNSIIDTMFDPPEFLGYLMSESPWSPKATRQEQLKIWWLRNVCSPAGYKGFEDELCNRYWSYLEDVSLCDLCLKKFKVEFNLKRGVWIHMDA